MQNLTELSPIAQVVEVSAMKQDKNDRNFKTLRLEGLAQSYENHGGVNILVTNRSKQVSMNQWEESYLDGRPSPFFGSKVGDHIGVSIFQAVVEPYEITNQSTGEVREVNSYTFPVIRGENPVTALRNAGHELAGAETTVSVVNDAPFAING
jgi:hypothetical protein